MNDVPLLTWKGKRVRFPGESPADAIKKVPSAPLRPGSLFFIPSPLEGWGLDILLERLPPESAVVLQELDSDLETYCKGPFGNYMGKWANDPRLFILSADTEDAIQKLFRKLPLSNLRRCEFLTLNGAWMAHRDRYRQVFDRIDRGLTQWWANRMTCIAMGPLWIRNLFDNIPNLPRQMPSWPCWNGETVLVCGAGVTLESVLPWAEENREHLRILAVDTALPILKAWNLVPDGIVCLEAQHANLRDFIGWTGKSVDLFTDLTSFPGGTRVLSGKTFWFISRFTDINLWDRWPWPEVPIIPPLGSVGVAASWVALKLSAGNIILAGLDFSFPPGKSHSRGAPTLATLASRTGRFAPMDQLGVWERPGTHRMAKTGWFTTPVMESYAAVLTELLAQDRNRVYVWDEHSHPLGIRPWEGRLTSSVQEKPMAEFQSMDIGCIPKDWLDKEIILWEEILDSFKELNKNPGSKDIEDRLFNQLADVDYLTFSFADPEPKKTSSWLIRAQVQIHWILSRVKSEISLRPRF